MKVELTSLMTVPQKWNKRVAKFEADWFKSAKNDAESMNELVDFIERYTDDYFYGTPFRLTEDIYNTIFDVLTNGAYVIVGKIAKEEVRETVGAIAVIVNDEAIFMMSENEKNQIK